VLGIVGIAISAPALAMSISPFTQMMWGRPKLKFEFVEFTGTDGKNLICQIKNEPVENRFHKFVGVTRDTGELNASLTLIEQGTRKIIIPHVPVNINDAASRQMGTVVNCRPHLSVMFPVIHCTDHGPIVFDLRRNEEIPIPDGIYMAVILVICDDRPHKLNKSMQINSDPTRTFWF
jgi:hypothetical protein